MGMSERLIVPFRQWRCKHRVVTKVNWVERDMHGPSLWSSATCDDCGKRLPDETSIFDWDETNEHLSYARNLPNGQRMEIKWNEHGQYYTPLT